MIRKCDYCLHDGGYENNKRRCFIGYDTKAGCCKAFTPADAEIEEKYAKEIVNDLVSTPLIYMGLAIIVLALIVCFVAGFEVLGDYALWALFAIGVVCLTVASALRYLYYTHRKDLEERVRDDVEQKVRNELLPKPLTRKFVKEYLLAHNHQLETICDGNGWEFTSRELRYAVYYDNFNRMVIRNVTLLDREQVDLVEHIIKCLDNKTFAIEMRVQEFAKENGESGFALEALAEFLVEDINNFMRIFPHYFANIETAVNSVYDTFNRCVEEQRDGRKTKRGDIYVPEYIWMPNLIQMVGAGKIPLEALTDEDWIRDMIQKKCDDVAVRTEWSTFKINRVENYGDYKLIVYQFPEPKVVPEAKYGVVLLNKITKRGSYYTLEMSHNNKWYYGGVANHYHKNYGEAESSDLEKFIEWIFRSNKPVVTSTKYSANRIES